MRIKRSTQAVKQQLVNDIIGGLEQLNDQYRIGLVTDKSIEVETGLREPFNHEFRITIETRIKVAPNATPST